MSIEENNVSIEQDSIEELAKKTGQNQEKIKYIIDEYENMDNFKKMYMEDKLPVSSKAELLAKEMFRTVINVEFDANAGNWDELYKDIIPKKPAIYSIEELKLELKDLSPQARMVIEKRYGLDESSSPKTLKSISDELGLSSERIRQITAKSIRELRMNHIYDYEDLVNNDDFAKVIYSNDIIYSNVPYDMLQEKDKENIREKFEVVKKEIFEDRRALKKIGLTENAYLNLIHAGVTKMSDFEKLTDEDLNNKYFKAKTIKKIKEKLNEIKNKEKESSKCEKTENISVRDIYGLTPKTYDLLEETGITSLEELTSKNIKQLAEIKNLRSDSLKRLIVKLQEMGYEVDEKGDFVYTLSQEESNNKTLSKAEHINLSSMGFSDRIYMNLKSAGISSIQDLAQMSESDIRKINNIGDKNFNVIMDKMQQYGYSFRKGSFVYSGTKEIDKENTQDKNDKNQVNEEPTKNLSELEEARIKRDELIVKMDELEFKIKEIKELMTSYDKLLNEEKTVEDKSEIRE